MMVSIAVQANRSKRAGGGPAGAGSRAGRGARAGAPRHAGEGPATLPDALDIVSVESAVATDQWQEFDLGLSCQHAVERVAMVTGQLVYSERVRQADSAAPRAIIAICSSRKAARSAGMRRRPRLTFVAISHAETTLNLADVPESQISVVACSSDDKNVDYGCVACEAATLVKLRIREHRLAPARGFRNDPPLRHPGEDRR